MLISYRKVKLFQDYFFCSCIYSCLLYTSKIQIYWTVLYTWYRFDYYENATVFGKLLHGIGAVLHIPMGKAYKGYEKLCTCLLYTSRCV